MSRTHKVVHIIILMEAVALFEATTNTCSFGEDVHNAALKERRPLPLALYLYHDPDEQREDGRERPLHSFEDLGRYDGRITDITIRGRRRTTRTHYQREQRMYFLHSSNLTQFVSHLIYVIEALDETNREKKRLTWTPGWVLMYPEPMSGEDASMQYKIYETTKDVVTTALEKWKEKTKMLQQPFQANAQVYVVFQDITSSSCSYILMEVYGVKESVVVRQAHSTVSSSLHFISSLLDFFVERVKRRADFYGARLLAISARDPTNWLEAPGPGVNNPLEILNDGTVALPFSELKYALNFSATYEIEDWIGRHPNNTLKGKTVDRFRGKTTDIFIGMVSLLPYRATELSFLQPTYSDGINGFFIQPEASSLRDLVLGTFPFSIWLCICLTYLLVVICILAMSFSCRLPWGREKSVRSRRKWRRKAEEGDSVFTNESLMWVLGTLCQQSWHQPPKSDYLRVVFIVGYFTGLFCYVAFSGAIVSVLAIHILPIKNRMELLNSALKFYVDSKSSTMAYVAEDLKATTKAKFGPPASIEEGIGKLTELKPAVFLAFPHYFFLIAGNMSLTEQWICHHIYTLPVTLSPTPHAMIVGKNSPYFESFNYILVKRFERGLHHRFVTTFNRETTTACLKDAQSFAHPTIGIGDVFSSYVILTGGFFIGFILLVLEKISILQQLRSKSKLLLFKKLKDDNEEDLSPTSQPPKGRPENEEKQNSNIKSDTWRRLSLLLFFNHHHGNENYYNFYHFNERKVDRLIPIN